MHSSIAQPHRQRAASEADLYHHYEARPLQHRRSLTPREMDVLKLLVEGLTKKAIARGLFISEVTAKKHVQSIIAKLDACDRTEAAVKAVRAGLLDVYSRFPRSDWPDFGAWPASVGCPCAGVCAPGAGRGVGCTQDNLPLQWSD